MPRPPKDSEAPLTPSKDRSSSQPTGEPDPQLSDSDGVDTDVGTAGAATFDQSVLMAAMGSSAGLSSVLGSETDAEIMLRVKAGDQSAFDYLVQKYRRPLVSFMYRMARNSAAAEDLAQEVFLRVYRSRESYEASAKFTTWLYRIATNLAVNHARDTRHERPEVQVSIDEPDTDTGMTMDVADSHLSAEEN